MRANYVDLCPRCDNVINVGDEVVLTHRETYIHRRCASGQDDE